MTSSSPYDIAGPQPDDAAWYPGYPGGGSAASGSSGAAVSGSSAADPASVVGPAVSSGPAAGTGNAAAWPAGYTQASTHPYPQDGAASPGGYQQPGYSQSGAAYPGGYPLAGYYQAPGQVSGGAYPGAYPQPVVHGPQYLAYPVGKSKVAAGVLGILFGWLGVHNFYLGYGGKGAGQLCLTICGLLTLILGIGFLIIMGTSIWGLIEGIMILSSPSGTRPWGMDAQGVP
ncbi:TM2 domain-containing protein [Actinomyces lilanjuaniae]|uniref:TM2 domain-containing protein n=1 Tax=Actinomyces lilanjuaniae TaxID=2321394 RepID=A0ABM6Z6A7_9ACTO|nr:TM2 domain-containing protein [Actinomyces lilanjuaniae]AYD90728.1 TM2 domain-containing protein [Actinomyces lilanjuaniae]